MVTEDTPNDVPSSVTMKSEGEGVIAAFSAYEDLKKDKGEKGEITY